MSEEKKEEDEDKHPPPKVIQKAFDIFDVQGLGYILTKELRRVNFRGNFFFKKISRKFSICTY
jgi:Ca2+-binding EF-hand superfamily protein